MTNARVLTLAALILAMGGSAAAQSPQGRIELSSEAIGISLANFNRTEDAVGRPRPAGLIEPGLGLGTAVRLRRTIWLEARGVLFPRYRGGQKGADLDTFGRGGSKSFLLAGPKLVRRVGRTELAVRVQAGLVQFSAFPKVFGISRGAQATLLALGEDPQRAPLLDAGVAIGWRLSPRIVTRVGVDGILIWYRPEPRDLNPAFQTENAKISIGFGFTLK